jgi:hypothetical protein
MYRRTVALTSASLLFIFTAFGNATVAAIVTYHSQPDWQTAVGGAAHATVFHFDGATELHGKVVNDPTIVPSYSSQGVDFLPFIGTNVYPRISRGQGFQIPDTSRDGLLGNDASPNPITNLEGRAIRFDFNIPAMSVGVFTNRRFDGDGGYLEAFDATMNPIGRVDLAAGVFGGIVSDQVISHVAIVNTFNSDITFGIWDLQFSRNGIIPEPTSACLLGITVLGMLVALIARRSRSC